MNSHAEVAQEFFKLWDAGQLRKYSDNTFKVLGEGNFSCVFEHPSDPTLCVKVSHNSKDSGVLYAYWARSMFGKLPGLPNILHIQEFISTDGSTITVVIMQRYKITVNEVWKNFLSEPDSSSKAAICVPKMVQLDLFNLLEYGPGMESKYRNEAKPYIQTINAIRQFFKGKADFDLHDENVMIDENGDYIIIDPVSFKKQEIKDYDQEEPI